MSSPYSLYHPLGSLVLDSTEQSGDLSPYISYKGSSIGKVQEVLTI